MRLFFLSFFMFCMLTVSTGHAETEKITVVADEWCPFNCAPDSDLPGILIEIAQKAFSKKGIEIDYQIVPWERALEGVREGKFNAAVGASTGDAPDFIFPGEGIDPKMSFFVLKGSNIKIEKLEDLSKISLGSISGYSYNSEIDKYIDDNQGDIKKIQLVAGEDGLEMNIKKLLHKRIDAFVDSELVGKYTLSSFPERDQVLAIPAPLSNDSNEVFLAFSPKIDKSKEYAQILSDELKSLKNSGELNKILARYGINRSE